MALVEERGEGEEEEGIWRWKKAIVGVLT